MQKVIKQPNGCWEWQGAKEIGGYGVLVIKACKYRIHRVVYVLSKEKEIEKGKVIMHACDNPRCCNPKHLNIGTKAENSKDMVNKLRQNWGKKNGNVKLTEGDVLRIREMIKTMKAKKIASIFKVTVQNIGAIKRRSTWKFL